MSDLMFNTIMIIYVISSMIAMGTVAFYWRAKEIHSVNIAFTIFLSVCGGVLIAATCYSHNEELNALKGLHPGSVISFKVDVDLVPWVVAVASVGNDCAYAVGDSLELRDGKSYQLVILGKAAGPSHRYLASLDDNETCATRVLIERGVLALGILKSNAEKAASSATAQDVQTRISRIEAESASALVKTSH